MQSESAISVSPHPYQERNVVTQNTLILFGVLRVFNEKIKCILGCTLKASCTMMMSLCCCKGPLKYLWIEESGPVFPFSMALIFIEVFINLLSNLPSS